MSKLERGYFVMNLDEIFLMSESALEPMMQQNAIIEPLSILLKISLKRQPNQNPSLFRHCGILDLSKNQMNGHFVVWDCQNAQINGIKIPQ